MIEVWEKLTITFCLFAMFSLGIVKSTDCDRYPEWILFLILLPIFLCIISGVPYLLTIIWM